MFKNQRRSSAPRFWILAALLVVATRLPAMAGVNTWTPTGPDGGAVTVLAVDPLNTNVVYAVSGSTVPFPSAIQVSGLRSGLFKSIDGGRSWRSTDEVSDDPLGYVAHLIPQTILAFAIDPAHPSTMYASVNGLFIAKSLNGGATWFSAINESPATSVLGSSPGIVSVTVDGGGNVYASSIRQLSVFASMGGVEPWTLAQVSDVVKTLAAGPASGVAYGVSSSAVVKTSDAGRTWVSLPSAPPGASALAVDPRDSEVVYLAGAFGVARSIDGGATWTSLGFPGTAFAIAVSSGPPFEIVAAGGLSPAAFSSTGDGQWTRLGPLTGNEKSIGVVAGGRILVANEAGVQVVEAEALIDANRGLSALSVPAIWTDPRVPSVILASGGEFGAPGPYLAEGDGSLYRSTDSGGHWGVVYSGEGMISIAGDSGDPNRLVALGSHSVVVSSDGGRTWTQGGSMLPASSPYSLNAVAADPKHSGVFYAAGVRANTSSPDPAIYRSTDFGATWSQLSALESLTIPPRSLQIGPIRGIYPDPVIDSTIWIYFGPAYVAVSHDAGVTWSLTDERPYFLSAVLDARAPGTAYRLENEQGFVDGVERTTNAGASWQSLVFGLRSAPSIVRSTALDYSHPGSIFAGTDRGVFQFSVVGNPSQCSDTGRSLCLKGGRFRVEVTFSANGTSIVPPHALPVSSDTGTFRFFSEENLELMVKVLDGRPVNGKFWVFLGSLSDVAYTVRVTDVETGNIWTHENPQGTVATVADTAAFPGSGEVAAADNPPPGFGPATVGPSPCGGNPATSLCFLGGRFRAEAIWSTPTIGSGPAVAVPLTGVAGAMWFFSPNNLELLMKVVDGRAVNGKFWVFVGGLTDVEYNLTVTDTQTGAVWRHHNARGDLTSLADTTAF